MPDKTGSDGQPSLEKLEREGVTIRKCIAYEELGEYGGSGGSAKAPAPKASKPARSSKGGY